MYLDVNKNLRGYGGMCLPKDVQALQNLFEKLHMPYSLLQSVNNDNNKFTKTIFNGMRDDI